MTPDRRTIFALFSLAFGLRILYAALIGTNPDLVPNPLTHDYYPYHIPIVSWADLRAWWPVLAYALLTAGIFAALWPGP